MIARPIPLAGLTLASPYAAEQLATAWAAPRRHLPPQSYAGGWLLITQPDHAALSGEFARHWGNELFPPPPQRDEVVTAIAHHDDGWGERDALPCFFPPTRGPQNFLDLEPDEFTAISRRSIELARQRSALGGYLVSWHFLKLAEGRSAVEPAFAAVPEVQGFMAEQRRNQASLRFALASLSDQPLLQACRLLQFGDMLSIFLCLGALEEATFPQEFTLRSGASVRIALHFEPEATVVLSPYPFDRSLLRFEISGRRLDRPCFNHQEDLAEAYAGARSERLSVEFRAG